MKGRKLHSRNARKSLNNNNPDLREVVSRKEVCAATINMSGRCGLGLTPKYKVDMMKDYLQSVNPDVIILQDAIDHNDIITVLEDISHGSLEWHFRPDQSVEEKETEHLAEEEMMMGSCLLTGIVWNKDKYLGTPLKMDDHRLTHYSKWLKKHNVAIVKLDSAQRINQGTEDVYPSMVAISWHGPDYETALKERTVICREFFDFVAALRKNNWHIPILIGGDFNMDMKSFNLEPNYSDFLYVPYRPVSGSLAKDLKNTFLFTVDSLQVTETAFKQCHPDIYPSPFISVKIRGRTKIKLWAVVRIQRCIRAYLQRAQEKKAGRKKLKDSKKRWKRKIEGDKYVSEPESDNEPEMAKKNGNAAVVGSDAHQIQDEDCTVMVPMANHRRKKYADLKSIYEKREEMRSNEFNPSNNFK